MPSTSLFSRLKIHRHKKEPSTGSAKGEDGAPATELSSGKTPTPAPSKSSLHPPTPPTSSQVRLENQQSQRTVPSLASESDGLSPNSIAERLWNGAYDALRESERKIIDAYENLLSRELEGKDGTGEDASKPDDNVLPSQDPRKRWVQMEQLVQVGLKKTERENKWKQGVSEAMEGVLSVKDLIGSAVETIPQAAPAWVAICFSMQIFVNATNESKVNRDGVVHVISRMKWYCELSSLLLKESSVDAETFAGPLVELEGRVRLLYQALLLYLIKTVCGSYRNRILATLRDAIKLDDWGASLQDIEEAEAAVRRDSYMYTNQQISSRLEQLVDVAKNQEARLLTDIQSLLQQQNARELAKEDNECLRHLRVTDPRDDKTRIEETKGGLLKESYYWILQHADFQQWQDEEQSRLLWIKGDPGKGKTMLMCGIINELEGRHPDCISFFFCQATDSRINKATAILRGLIYGLIQKQPWLISHVRKKYDSAGKAIFEDSNAWVTLSALLTDILEDSRLQNGFMMIDGLDECTTDLPRLLDFIAQRSTSTFRTKWIVSSRNWPEIEERLNAAGQRVGLSLELNAESVSAAVRTYIEYKVRHLAELKKYDVGTRDAVLDHLIGNANDTFLWVALACQNLETVPRWSTLEQLKTFPPGLNPFYNRMLDQLCDSANAELSTQVLASITAAYAPLTLGELACIVERLEKETTETSREVVESCGSFLTLRKGTIFFVHQSAKDFLSDQASSRIHPQGIKETHRIIFSRSISTLRKVLKRDMYGLRDRGFPSDLVVEPPRDYQDLLANIRYPCVSWLIHLTSMWHPEEEKRVYKFEECGTIVESFMRKYFLCWFEAVGILKYLDAIVPSIWALITILKESDVPSRFLALIQDAYRFIMYHKGAIEHDPLQAHYSTLIFTPKQSLLRRFLKQDEPSWVDLKPGMQDHWGACLQSFDDHTDWVRAVAFSESDPNTFASASRDRTVKVWGRSSGCLKTLKGHENAVNSVAYSRDRKQLASSSYDGTIMIWEGRTQDMKCLHTLSDHTDGVKSVSFSFDCKMLASGSDDKTIMIWDTESGDRLETVSGHHGAVNSVAFSLISNTLASGSDDRTIKIWDVGYITECLRTLEGHDNLVNAVAFSHDETMVASASDDHTIKIWNTQTGDCLRTFIGHEDAVNSISFSPNSARLASGSRDKTVKLWVTATGQCTHTYGGYTEAVKGVAFVPDGRTIAAAGHDRTIKLWDATHPSGDITVEMHHDRVNIVVLSQDSARLASASYDLAIKVWDTSTGKCLHTLKGHEDTLTALSFSADYKRLASASCDRVIKIWDVGKRLVCLHTFRVDEPIVHLALSDDLSKLASVSLSHTIVIWDVETGEPTLTIEADISDWAEAAPLAEQTLDLTSTEPPPLEANSTTPGTPYELSDTANSVALSMDLMGLEVASSNRSDDADEPEDLGITRNILVFSEDCALFASAFKESSIDIWSMEAGQRVQTLLDHTDSVSAIAFSADSTRIASASHDGTVKIWESASGNCLRSINLGFAVKNVSFDSSGSHLETDMGAIGLDPALEPTQADIDAYLRRSHNWSVTLDGLWIRHNEKNFLYLPSEFRPSCCTTTGQMIALGGWSGRVLTCKASVDEVS